MNRQGNGNEWVTISLDGEKNKVSRGRNTNYLVGLNPGVWDMIWKSLDGECLFGAGEAGV